MTESNRNTLAALLEGARSFHDDVFPDYRERFEKLAETQAPATLFITCADSRIDPCLVTQTKPGELFIVRNVGNIVPPYGEMLGGVSSAIEYAVGALGVKNIVVCGHSNCGAMGALMDLDAPKLAGLPTVRRWLQVSSTARAVAGALKAEDAGPPSVRELAEQNVLLQLAHLRTHPAVATALALDKLTLQGWFYDIPSGEISVLDEASRRAITIDDALDAISGRSGILTRAGRFLAALVPALALAISAGAGTAAAPIKIATWNLDWLTARPANDPDIPADVGRRTDADIARLAAYARHLDADVIGFQEVDGPAIAQRVFPPDRYQVALTPDAIVQRVGIAVRRGIAVTVNPEITALDVSAANAAHHLRGGLDVTLSSGTARLRVLVVHLKTGCWDQPLSQRAHSCPTLLAQFRIIDDWVLERQDEGEAFAVVGDFNRRLTMSDPMMTMLEADAPLTLTTAGFASPCWAGEYFIDHVLLGNAARQWLVPGSLRVMTYAEGDSARAALSDHCPVSVRLAWPG